MHSIHLEYDLVDDGTFDTVIDVSCPICEHVQRERLSDTSDYRNPETGELTGLGNLIRDIDGRISDTWECACSTLEE